jgi:hypothetical protein
LVTTNTYRCETDFAREIIIRKGKRRVVEIIAGVKKGSASSTVSPVVSVDRKTVNGKFNIRNRFMCP